MSDDVIPQHFCSGCGEFKVLVDDVLCEDCQSKVPVLTQSQIEYDVNNPPKFDTVEELMTWVKQAQKKA